MFNQCIDMKLKQDASAWELEYVEVFEHDNSGITIYLQADSISYPARLLTAFRILRKHSNRHGNLYPWRQLLQFLLFLPQVLYLNEIHNQIDLYLYFKFIKIK